MHDGNRKGENRPQKDQNSDEGGQSRGAEGKEEMGKKASSPTHIQIMIMMMMETMKKTPTW